MSLPKIQHSTFTAEIPSTKKTVRFRQFTAREEKILLMAKASEDVSDMLAAIRQIVNNCIITEGFNVDTLTIFDLEWLFLTLRKVSVSNVVPQSYKDNEDNKVYEFEIDLEKVKIVWPIEKPPTISLGEGLTMTMKWPTADLYNDTQLLRTEGIEALERLLVRCIDKIYTADQVFDPADYTSDDLIEFISDIDVKSYEQIQSFFEKMPRMEYVIEYTNANETKRRIELNSLVDFFQF
jgi:hypothetical protein